VATELFKEFGYERASMNELAKRLGGSKATLYGYFPSKEALFSAVVQGTATPYLTEAAQNVQVSAESPEALKAALMSFAEKLLSVVLNDASAMAVYRMVVAEAGRSDVGELFDKFGPRESIATLARWLGAAVDRGYLRKADPKILAIQFTALAAAETGVRIYQRNPPTVSRPEVRQMAKRAVEMFLAGASPK